MGEKDAMFMRVVKFLVYTLFAVCVAGLGFLAFKYVVPRIVPFIFAWLVAAMLQPLINWLNKKYAISRKISSLVLVLLALGLIGTLCYFIINRAVREVFSLAGTVKEIINELSNNDEMVNEWIDKIASVVPFIDVTDKLHEIVNEIDEIVLKTLSAGVSKLDSIVPQVTNLVTTVFSSAVNILLGFIIMLVSTYYFAVDYNKIGAFVSTQFSDKTRSFSKSVKTEFLSTIVKFLKAYGTIIILTFAELFIMFLFLGIDYAFLIALCTSIIDILPVLGTGTILIPWSVYQFITGDIGMGIALIIVYLVVLVVRQIMEPRIVGSYIGLYPVVTLIAMYAGLKTFGILGLFLFPIIAIIAKNLNDKGVVKLWKPTPEGVWEPEKKKEKFNIVEFVKKRKNKKNTDDKSE